MINTLNESSLHEKLKKIYAKKFSGKTEIELCGKIFDIVCADSSLIEIQTQNISKLKEKIVFAISEKRKLKIVFPFASEKKIALYNENEKIISEKKSTAKKNVFDLFRELTSVCALLPNENISIDALEISLLEKRVETLEPVQSKNKKRRKKKAWLKFDKELLSIHSLKTFQNAHDYVSLLPKNLSSEFSIHEFAKLTNAKKKQTEKLRIFLWCLEKMKLVKKIKKENGKVFFRKKLL